MSLGSMVVFSLSFLILIIYVFLIFSYMPMYRFINFIDPFKIKLLFNFVFLLFDSFCFPVFQSYVLLRFNLLYFLTPIVETNH